MYPTRLFNIRMSYGNKRAAKKEAKDCAVKKESFITQGGSKKKINRYKIVMHGWILEGKSGKKERKNS